METKFTTTFLTNRGRQFKMVVEQLLFDFPEVGLAFAYGSGVFTQNDNANTKDNMLDVVFVVEDSFKWHKSNLRLNKSHYSIFARVFGLRMINCFQNDFSANIYFNTLVPWNGRLVKYGVISKQYLIEDLVDWTSLYVSGRLHKPVKFLSVCPTDIQCALNKNLHHAIRTSLLCLPDRFLDEELFMQITNLSYGGDFRMVIGENKNKVSNIVKPNIEHFRKLYYPLLNEYDINICNNFIHQNCDAEKRFELLQSLPKNLKGQIIKWQMPGLRLHPLKSPSNEMQDAILYSLAHNNKKTSELALRGARSIVRYSSISQSLKGIITAGMLKSVVYSSKKVGKMFRGMLK
ncbi:phosphatidate cytidylyltransferase, mitochondrial-like [Dendronephthya gigantea]|uniref:phosphatidate cytidylyltransferase, mitochondrial-like n=1 Tax=Dendronephthya gigantea TaxID=151771 RepID=UPI00106A13CA|nr:phosphatidate cytidylyltransferase, mitochondrial-like [Dendronephthya gigantea]